MSAKIAVITNHTPSLFWFRMDMMKHFRTNGYEVLAIGNEQGETGKRDYRNMESGICRSRSQEMARILSMILKHSFLYTGFFGRRGHRRFLCIRRKQ